MKQYTFDLAGRIEVNADSEEKALAELVSHLRGRGYDELLEIVRPKLMGTKTPDTNPAPAPSQKAEDYCHIAAWHSTSFSYYLSGMQALAVREGAPLDVVYKRHEGEWVRVTDLFDDERTRINTNAEAIRERIANRGKPLKREP